MDFKSLNYKLKQIKGKLSRFKKYLDEQFNPEKDVFELKTRLANNNSLLEEFESIHMKIEMLESKKGIPALEKENEEFEKTFFAVIGKAESLLHAASDVFQNKVKSTEDYRQQGNPCDTSNMPPKLKLPTLSIPFFFGDYEGFITFRDMFTSLVHNNTSLSNIQKLYYLKSSVRGAAAQVIDTLALTSDNYDVAWSLLNDRFYNKNLIIEGHVKAMFELPHLTKESAIDLRRLLDNFAKHLKALEALQLPVDKWDTLLNHILLSKVDKVTFRNWQSESPRDTLPTFNELMQFLRKQCLVLESLSPLTSNISSNNTTFTNSKFSSHKCYLVSNQETMLKCPVCSESHAIFLCPIFLKLPIADRISKVRACNLCTNCLKSGHRSFKCLSGKCKTCNKGHNTLLHLEVNRSPSNKPFGNDLNSSRAEFSAQKPEALSTHNYQQANVSSCYSTQSTANKVVLLPTALINIMDNNGQFITARALLDSASSCSFISETLVQRLRLKTSKSNCQISGISASLSKSNNTTIKSKCYNFGTSINLIVLPKISENIPSSNIPFEKIQIPHDMANTLADPSFYISSQIDLLIGAELFWDIVSNDKRHMLGSNGPWLVATKFGWIVSGQIEAENQNLISCFVTQESQRATKNHKNQKEKNQRFCLTENIPGAPILSGLVSICENQYQRNIHRDATERDIVSVPLREQAQLLHNNSQVALNRFHILEKRLSRTQLRSGYSKFKDENESLGHMEKLDEQQIHNLQHQPHYYIPHHRLCKELSSPTKASVVFDASAKSSTGHSLNDILMVGPFVQDDLLSILIRFRTHLYVMVADIGKMYQKILIERNQSNLQLIFWRKNPTGQLQTYRLKTVTYGKWEHVSRNKNLADLVSKGGTNCNFWWHGPQWLTDNVNFDQPSTNTFTQIDHDLVPERKGINSFALVSISKNENIVYQLSERYSKYNTPIQVLAYCLRFIRNSQSKSEFRSKDPLATHEHKLIKTHKKRVIGNTVLTLTLFNTQIEACVNSRPIISLPNDPSDPIPLTPSHFLIGDILTSLPEQDLKTAKRNYLNQWQHCQQILQHFWNRWSKDY